MRIKGQVINKTTIFHAENFRGEFLWDYYNFILSELSDFCNKSDINKSIALGVGRNADIRIGLQTEPTIVVKNEKIECEIRFKEDPLNPIVDYLINYSNPNIENIRLNGNRHENFVKKNIYIPPIIYKNIQINNNNRIYDVCTLHHDTERRTSICNDINLYRINGIYNKEIIKQIYDQHKILLNVHQNETHRTLEEIRVLPALASGLLVISEDVPFKKVIPYSKHIIWVSTDKIKETLDDATKNYDDYHKVYLKDIEETISDLFKLIQKNFKNILVN
jgi:hypothetical protein